MVLLLILSALAAYRITRLVVLDSFPPVERARERLSARGESWDDMLHCPWCSGFWVSVLVGIAVQVAPDQWEPVAIVFALSAVVGIISEAVARWE